MKKNKQELVDAVIESLKKDFNDEDYTVLEGILLSAKRDTLINALPEEEGNKFKEEPKPNPDWLVVSYNKFDEVMDAFVIEERTEHEASKEAEADIPKKASDWTLNKMEVEVKQFVKVWGQSQTDLKSLEGLKGDSCAVSEMLINFGYVWVEKYKKWFAKNNSSYTKREETILAYIRKKYC